MKLTILGYSTPLRGLMLLALLGIQVAYPVALIAAGGSCETDFSAMLTPQCVCGYECVIASKKCEKTVYIDDGGACELTPTGPEKCKGSSFCYPADEADGQVCTAKIAAGGQCEPGYKPCAEGYFCDIAKDDDGWPADMGSCKERAEIGETCPVELSDYSHPSSCKSGLCSENKCADNALKAALEAPWTAYQAKCGQLSIGAKTSAHFLAALAAAALSLVATIPYF